MTDVTSGMAPAANPKKAKTSLLTLDAATKKRNAAEARFKAYGIAAIATGLFFLVALLFTIISNGIPAFTQTFITLDVTLEEKRIDKTGERDLAKIRKVTTFGYNPLLEAAIKTEIE